MRNWNLQDRQICHRPTFGFQTTYEELKPLSRNYRVSSGTASRLPMRNWNLSLYCFFPSSTIPASRLPMRNWNHRNTFRQVPSCSFQTTYEELKQRESHTEYERWLGFQTTYEELKHLPRPDNINIFRASRLPMRNWNMVLGTGDCQHLFGFQTTYEELKRLSSRKRSWEIPLPDYLWGIETVSVSLHFRPVLFSFQTTYEELKLSSHPSPPLP